MIPDMENQQEESNPTGEIRKDSTDTDPQENSQPCENNQSTPTIVTGSGRRVRQPHTQKKNNQKQNKNKKT